MQLEYESGRDDFDRVLSQEVGGTNASGIAAGGTRHWSYDDGTQTTRWTDATGARTDYTWLETGPCTEVIEDPTVAPLTTAYTYDDEGLLTRATAPLGNATMAGSDPAAAVSERSAVRWAASDQPVRTGLFGPGRDPTSAGAQSSQEESGPSAPDLDVTPEATPEEEEEAQEEAQQEQTQQEQKP